MFASRVASFCPDNVRYDSHVSATQNISGGQDIQQVLELLQRSSSLARFGLPSATIRLSKDREWPDLVC